MSKEIDRLDWDAAINRRRFILGAAAAGAGLVLSGKSAFGQAPQGGAAPVPAPPAGNEPELKVAIIGVGSQGKNLLSYCLKIPGIRFVAVCDIWPYNLNGVIRLLKKYNQVANPYTNYQEMLAKEKGLDAIIVATPDWMHSEHTVACLKYGAHVYCEKEMSNTIEGARAMVKAQHETKKLLQIGHQRRSNPRYLHAIKLIEKDKILGRITNVEGQWNRPVADPIGCAKNIELDAATLKQFGYETMERFLNWRWFKKYSGGPISDLGSHQIDVFNWVLKTNPQSVLASGGQDYYKGREWYDNVLTIFEYQTAAGPVRGFYKVLNTTSYGGFFEVFMGDEGSMVISEDVNKGFFFKEVKAKKRQWEEESTTKKVDGQETFELKIGETLDPSGKKDPKGQALLAESQKPPHQLHLENFFNALRHNTPISCPADVGFESAVSVLRINEAVASGQRLEFKPEEFKA